MEPQGFPNLTISANGSAIPSNGSQQLYFPQQPMNIDAIVQRISQLERAYNGLAHQHQVLSLELADTKVELSQLKKDLDDANSEIAQLKEKDTGDGDSDENESDEESGKSLSKKKYFDSDILTEWTSREYTFDLKMWDTEELQPKTVDFEQVAQNLALSGKPAAESIRPFVKGVLAKIGNDQFLSNYSLSDKPRNNTSFPPGVVQRTAWAVCTACGENYATIAIAAKAKFFGKVFYLVNHAFNDYFNNLRRKRSKPSPDA